MVKSFAASHRYLHSQKSFTVTSFTSFHSIHMQKFAKKVYDCKVICKKRETSLPQIISNIHHIHAVFTVDIFPYQSSTRDLTECQCLYLTSYILSCLYTLY